MIQYSVYTRIYLDSDPSPPQITSLETHSQQVYCNSRPYAGSTESYSDIIQSVKDCTTPAYRPKLTTQHCNNERKL